MITNTQKQIAATKAKLEALEKKAAAEAAKKLTNLHENLGFATRADLIAALSSLESGGAKRGRKPKAATKKAAKPAKAGKRAKRAKITEELKAKVIEAVNNGGKGADIAKEFGISIPSLQNIKKAAGLTKPRGKK
ncbi:helix-turn-helix domain-containing protein [Pelagicoccus sp. NFK12]|uniref:Helix-turn-helix domain-containing protein n=1 Tax=Pelagicoccus enzymogenes TaxID=2773457 RepID=A0A927IHL1_9BACT|nr:helix-turn-helix domain-containing protein [Pelagicoccus enzymogenes]MBD5780316.1 helix-turn-helix domain-containing protein [Pelagicoccus enzymogenes]MDQ8197781.1 hypothetical protein [Pelagicoccus enzymogenes]